MFQPKGLPIDIVAARSEQWDGDGHSHSWLTLAELKGYKESVIKYSGLLTVAQAEALDSNSEHPTIWCQASSDKSLVYREWQEEGKILSELIGLITKRRDDILWMVSDPSDKDVRIIFWFDN